MHSTWPRVSWGDLAVLEYGKALRGYQSAEHGDARVYGTNGPIGWTSEALGPGPTVIVGRKGAYRGVHYAPRRFWVIDTAYWLRAVTPVNSRWAYYQLLTQDINGRDSGSAIPSLSRSDFYSFPVDLPPRTEQDAIAEVLGALDDKIDANSRLATVCEELAVAYLSAVPGRRRLGDFVTMSRDQLKPEQFVSEVVEHFSLPAFDGRRMPECCSGTTIKSNKFLVHGPSVLVSKLNPHIPRVWYAEPTPRQVALASTEFVVLEPVKACTPAVLWAACAGPEFASAVAGRVTGTTGSHQRVTPQDVLDTVAPDVTALSGTQHELVDSLVLRALAARRESAVLARLRNGLLPPLISGHLRVRDVEESLPV